MTSRAVIVGAVGALVFLLVSCSELIKTGDCQIDSDCNPGSTCSVDNGLCRSIRSGADCRESIGPWDEEGSLVLGFVAPLSGENAESGLYLRRAVELAVEEINRVGGVGGGQNGKQLAVLLCDDQGDGEIGVRAANHLVNVARTPAIVGSAFSRVTRRIAEEVTIPAGTLLISPASTAVEISDLDDNSLVWRTVPPDSRQADTMAHFATWEVLQFAGVSAQGDASLSTVQVRVALIYPDDVYGSGLVNSFGDALSLSLDTVLNLSGSGLTLGSDGLDLSVSSHQHVPGDSASMQEAAAAAVATDPDVVLLVGYDESTQVLGELLAAEEVRSTASFFLSDGMRSDALSTALGNTAERKPRLLFGTNPGGRLDTDTVWLEFRNRYADRWGEQPNELHNYVENAYDATYLLAYALAASQNAAPNGAEMAETLGRIRADAETTLLVGEGDALRAFSAFATGEEVILRGASGDIGFDDNGDPEAASILRWDLSFEPDTDTWKVFECGIASSYDVAGGRSRDWCAAYCTDTLPLHDAAGDDDDSAGDDDDSAGDDDDDDVVHPQDPCRPSVMG